MRHRNELSVLQHFPFFKNALPDRAPAFNPMSVRTNWISLNDRSEQQRCFSRLVGRR